LPAAGRSLLGTPRCWVLVSSRSLGKQTRREKLEKMNRKKIRERPLDRHLAYICGPLPARSSCPPSCQSSSCLNQPVTPIGSCTGAASSRSSHSPPRGIFFCLCPPKFPNSTSRTAAVAAVVLQRGHQGAQPSRCVGPRQECGLGHKLTKFGKRRNESHRANRAREGPSNAQRAGAKAGRYQIKAIICMELIKVPKSPCEPASPLLCPALPVTDLPLPAQTQQTFHSLVLL
jgi:hypothetical protein